MSRKIYEISLKSVVVKENGQWEEDQLARNLLAASLVYPAPGIPNVTTMKTMTLADRTPIDFETGEHPATGENYGYFDKLLFKEEFFGESKLVVSLSTIKKVSGFEKFLNSFFKIAFKLVWGKTVGMIGNVIFAKITENLAGLHTASIDAEKAKNSFIAGQATLPLQQEDLANMEPGESRDVTMELKIPETIKEKAFKFPDGPGKPQLVERILLRKSGPSNDNGELVLTIKAL